MKPEAQQTAHITQAEQLARKAAEAIRDARGLFCTDDNVQYILRETNLASLITEKEAWKRDAEALLRLADILKGCADGLSVSELKLNCDTILNHRALVEKYK